MQLCHPLKVVAGSQGTVGVQQIKMPVNNGLVQLRLKWPPYAVSFFGGNSTSFYSGRSHTDIYSPADSDSLG